MIEQVEYRGFTIEIHPEEFPGDPREWDNLGVMACWHRRYKLGDEQPGGGPREWLEGIENEILVLLPLYLYDHSGLCMSTSDTGWPFSCRWDSGQAGWIYVTGERLREEYGKQRISEKLRQKALSILRQEVETYNDYLSGAVFGYVVKSPGDTGIGDLWGFYGYDHEKSGLLPEARRAIDWYIKKVTERHAKQLKAWLFHKVPLCYRRPFPLEDTYDNTQRRCLPGL